MGQIERRQKRLAAGWQALERGDLRAAEDAARAELSKHPRDQGASELLGVSLYGQGRFREAAGPLREVFGNASAQGSGYRLGYCYLAAGDPARAESVLEQEVSRFPDFVESQNLLGISLAQQSREQEAVAAFETAIGIDPRFPGARNNLGNVFLQLGRHDEAIFQFGQAIDLQPRDARARYNLGRACYELRRYEAAIDCYREALKIEPRDWETHHALGAALASVDRKEEAIASFREAISIDPGNAKVHNDLGSALDGLNRHAEAIDCLERALTLNPDYAEALVNLGFAFRHLDRGAEAVACYQRALSLRPDVADVHHDLGNAYLDLGRYSDASASFEAALAIDPDRDYSSGLLAWSGWMFCRWENFAVRVAALGERVRAGRSAEDPFACLVTLPDSEDQLNCAKRYAANIAPSRLSPAAPYSHQKIRLAYLSADFRDHAVAYCLAELLETHDRDRFEVLAVSMGPDDKSEMRARLVKGVDRFIDVRGQSDRGAAEQVRDLEADIAIDLMGYTMGSRPGILAHRAAPIQVNYLGYPGTMGVEFIDYILADRFVLPEELQRFYAEKVAYLPDSYQANDSKRPIAEHTPGRAEVGLPPAGFVFCCFNNSYKIQPRVFGVWMRLLRNVPGSVLWLLRDNASAEENLRKEAAARGIAPERLVFATRVGVAEYRARCRLADLCLDTLPYNGHGTTSDMLWSGLPVLTCMGGTFAGRVAGSLLHAVGLPELVTTTDEEYEALAVKLATDLSLLKNLRERLQRNRKTAPLFDTDRFRQHIESAYTTMYEIRRRGEPPRSFAVDPVA